MRDNDFAERVQAEARGARPVRLNVYLPHGLATAIAARAKRERRSHNQVVVMLLESALAADPVAAELLAADRRAREGGAA